MSDYNDAIEESREAEGELPEGWAWTTLGDISTDAQYGYTTSAVESNDGPKLLRITDLSRMGVDWHTVPYCEQPPNDFEKYRLQDGDILIARSGATVGKAYRVIQPPDAVFASYLIRFRAIEVSDRYIEYFLHSPIYWSQIRDSSAGNTIPNVNASKMKALILPLAPLVEQRRIVEAIESLFTQLDAGVAALKRLRANLKRYKAAVLKAACEGRLVAQDPEDEPASALLQRILTERRAKWESEQRAKGKDPRKLKYEEPAAPDTSDLPELPEGWTWASVEEIGTIGEQAVLTGPFGSNLGRNDFTESGVPVLTIGCLKEEGLTLDKALYVSQEKADELARYRLRAGDLLFSRMASVGRAGLVTAQFEEALINYHIMRLRLAIQAIHPEFFINYVRGAKIVFDYLRNVNHGATRDGINTNQLLALPVALPPLDEQQRIVTEVDRYISIAQSLEIVIDNTFKRAERLRQAILKQAFEGKLVAQDANDEAAAVLLERINLMNTTTTNRRRVQT